MRTPTRGRAIRFALLGLPLVFIGWSVIASEEPSGSTPVTRVVRREVEDPLAEQIATLLEEEATELARLETQLAAAETHGEHMALQQQMAKVKALTEAAILELQQERAVRCGETELADELREAIDAILAPYVESETESR